LWRVRGNEAFHNSRESQEARAIEQVLAAVMGMKSMSVREQRVHASYDLL